MMFYVYLLKSQKDNRAYVGYTIDLAARIEKHNSGLVRSTRHRRPLTLIYYEAYASKTDAIIREQRLKKFAKGYMSLRSRIVNSYEKGEG